MEKILGLAVSEKEIEPIYRFVNKIRKLHPPQSVKEVEQLCGLLKFYGGFIRNLTSKIASIFDLRKRSEAEFQLNVTKEKLLHFVGLILSPAVFSASKVFEIIQTVL